MKILIISRTPWNNSNSFGNTFSNLFGGMPDVSIYNICCQSGTNENQIVEEYYQMSEALIIKRRLNKCTSQNDSDKKIKDGESQQTKTTQIHHKRNTFNYVCREIIWKLGKWRTKSLDQFIDNVNPDLIYLPLYSSGYTIDIQRYVVKRSNVPVVGHISDDIYGYSGKWITSPFKNLYRLWIRKKVRMIMKEIKYGEVFAQGMAEEYSKVFHKPYYVIGKGVREEDIVPNTEYRSKSTIDFVYTGNYGGERGWQLIKLANALDNCFLHSKLKPRLVIYSTTSSDDEIYLRLSDFTKVIFKEPVYGDDLRKVQQRADFLVHVEGFSATSIAKTKYSFSTKIIDYLLAQRPIFTIGPENINSIEVLTQNQMAIVSCNTNSIHSNLDCIAAGKIDTQLIIANGIKYLREKRNLRKIQSEMLQRFKSIKNG